MIRICSTSSRLLTSVLDSPIISKNVLSKYSAHPIKSNINWNNYRKFMSTDNPAITANVKKKDGWDKLAITVSTAALILNTGINTVLAIFNNSKSEKLGQRENAIKEKESMIEGAKMIGLVKARPLSTRTLSEQAKEFEKAKASLITIGATGPRMTDPKHDNKNNPIPGVVKTLVESKVNVTVLIYDPNKIENFFTDPVEQERFEKEILKTIEFAGPFENESRFKLKFIDKPPPFLGDLIDGEIANIEPIRLNMKGEVSLTQIIETYDRKFASEKDRFDQIKSDFDTLVRDAKTLKEVVNELAKRASDKKKPQT